MLKKLALESLSQAGAAYQAGDYAAAKDLAEKAWNCYFELQKQRSEDEDFTDLIYTARNQYLQAQAALEKQREDELEPILKFDNSNFSVADLEADLEDMFAKQKEAMLNFAPDSYEVFDAIYGVVIDMVWLCEKRIQTQHEWWKNIALIKRFIPCVKIMMRSPHLKETDRKNMLDLSLRILETTSCPYARVSPLEYPRLKTNVEKLIYDIAITLPDEDSELYKTVIDVLETYVDLADTTNLENIDNEIDGLLFDPVELTAKYEELAPEADKHGDAAYRLKGENATPQDFWNGKKLYLAALGINWSAPQEIEEDVDE